MNGHCNITASFGLLVFSEVLSDFTTLFWARGYYEFLGDDVCRTSTRVLQEEFRGLLLYFCPYTQQQDLLILQ